MSGGELSIAEKATNHATWQHIHVVQTLLMRCVGELQFRALTHDQTKLRDPEVETFTRMTPLLAGSTYGSEEYHGFLAEMKPALSHHYANNRHHPEHFEDGIAGMTLVDLLEMVCDWKAATLRHDDGDIDRSFEINAERFDIEPQLLAVLRNTVERYGWSGRTRVDVPVSQRDSE